VTAIRKPFKHMVNVFKCQMKKKKKGSGTDTETRRLGEGKRDGNRHRGESRAGAKNGKYRTDAGDKEGQKQTPPRGGGNRNSHREGGKEKNRHRMTGSEVDHDHRGSGAHLEFLRMIPTKPGNQGDMKTKLHGSRRIRHVAKRSTTASEHTSELNDGTNWR
jgi:hypothetical protein